MKNWKKQLNKELNSIIPELREDIKNAPIEVERREKITLKERFFNFFTLKTKKIFTVSLSFVLALVLAIALIPLVGVNKVEGVVVLEINPKVAFILDEKGVVKEVSSLNADCDVILQSEENLALIKGKKIDDAVENFTDIAFKLGYLKENGAVKISGVENERAMQGLKERVEEYFCEKGLFAVTLLEDLTEEEFCEKLATFGKKREEIVKNIKESTLFLQKEENKGRLKELYDSTVDSEELSNSVKNKLEDNKAKFEEYKNLVLDIEKLNDIIINSEDNPGIIGLKDYWNIKNGLYFGTLTEDFKALLTEMTALLNEYSTKYGNTIESYLSLHSVKGEMEIIDGIIAGLDDEFVSSISSVLTFLKMIGANPEHLVNLFTTPETVDDYISKIKDYYTVKIENGLLEYTKVREKITSKDYEGYIAKIVATHGSIENYFESLK
ncbi:MAG: hypothetical protein IKC71_02135 [Clostridia bacterium]|nr:hypothetical protein [Clostridia bacterium]